ncbi:MAG TPA: hypothetical protein VGW38_22360 [Chloroflexota bacterium]|nr:hypothetical protein [Chloroflexota bacterium]
MNLAEDPREREQGQSWPERVLEVLKRIFIPEPEPALVPVPVVVRPGVVRRRR